MLTCSRSVIFMVCVKNFVLRSINKIYLFLLFVHFVSTTASFVFLHSILCWTYCRLLKVWLLSQGGATLRGPHPETDVVKSTQKSYKVKVKILC